MSSTSTSSSSTTSTTSQSSSSSPSSASSPSSSSSNNPSSKFFAAAATIEPLKDFTNLATVSCARQSLLFGISAGVAVGCVTLLFSRRSPAALAALASTAETGGTATTSRFGLVRKDVYRACNLAAGGFGVGSLGAWETLRARETEEANRMNDLVHQVKAKRAAKATPASPDQGIRGVLMGEQGKEILRERERVRIEKEATGLSSLPRGTRV